MIKLIGTLLLLATMSAHAVSEAQIKAVQMPAWIQRGEQVEPLRVGAELRTGDKLITGTGARVYVQTVDGSIVKLGENATLVLEGLSQQHDEQSLFNAVLNVAKGAFRFTTATAAKLKPRNVTVKVAGATIGIRGTDVWGKVGGKISIAAMEKAMGQGLSVADKETKMDFDTVCLIEGKISVTHENEAPFVMDQAQSFYIMPKDVAPLPVSSLSSEQLTKWAAETEISKPASQVGGLWKVDLLTVADQASVLTAYDQWRAAGYDVRVQPIAREGGWVYTLRIVELSSHVEAVKLAAQLKGALGAETPSVSR